MKIFLYFFAISLLFFALNFFISKLILSVAKKKAYTHAQVKKIDNVVGWIVFLIPIVIFSIITFNF